MDKFGYFLESRHLTVRVSTMQKAKDGVFVLYFTIGLLFLLRSLTGCFDGFELLTSYFGGFLDNAEGALSGCEVSPPPSWPLQGMALKEATPSPLVLA